ncbi:hypothetical protein LCGC14_1789240, partial [marine sediment metagenome]
STMFQPLFLDTFNTGTGSLDNNDATAQDFTNFNETDVPGKVTVAANTITLTNGDRDEDYYVTRNFGAGNITDFTHWVDVNVTAITADGNSSFYFDAISNADDDLYDIDAANGDCIFLGVGRIGAGYRVGIYNVDGGALTLSTGSTTNTLGDPVYISSSRAGTVLTAEVYSTAALRIAGGAGDVDTITHTVVATAFQFVYGLASYNNAGTAKDISGTVENLWLGVDGAARHTESLGGELVTDGAFANTSLAAAKGVTGITKATPGIVTFNAGHGYVDGTVLFFSGLTEMTELNNEYWKLRSNVGDTFELSSQAIGTWDTASLDTIGFGAAETTGGNVAQKTDFTSWTEEAGWHPGVDGAGALTGTADCDGEQPGTTNLTESAILTVGGLNKGVHTLLNSAAGSVQMFLGSSGGLGLETADDTYIKYGYVPINTNLIMLANIFFIGSIDDVSVKEVSQPSVLSMVNLGFQQGRYWLTPGTTIEGELVGTVLMANDSVASTDGVFVLIGRAAGKLNVFKRVAGTDTSLTSTSITYVDGAKLLTVWDAAEGKMWWFYNNAIVGVATAITDASLINNTWSGYLTTGDASNTKTDYQPLGYGEEFYSSYNFNADFSKVNVTASDADSFTTNAPGGVYQNVLTAGEIYRSSNTLTTSASTASVGTTDSGVTDIRQTIAEDAVGYMIGETSFKYIYIRNSDAGTTDVTAFSVRQLQ